MKQEEFMEKYGGEKVKFSSYYKYSFIFINEKGLSISVGGDSNDIYRFDVDVDKEYLVSDLEPNSACLNGESLGYWF